MPAVKAGNTNLQKKISVQAYSLRVLQSKDHEVQACSQIMHFFLHYKTEIQTCSPQHLQYEPGVQGCILACWHNVKSRYVVQACSPSLKFLSASFQSKPEVQNSSSRLLSHKCDVLTSCLRLLQFKLSV